MLPLSEEPISGEVLLWSGGVPIDKRSIRISVPLAGAMPCVQEKEFN